MASQSVVIRGPQLLLLLNEQISCLTSLPVLSNIANGDSRFPGTLFLPFNVFVKHPNYLKDEKKNISLWTYDYFFLKNNLELGAVEANEFTSSHRAC